MAGGNFIYVSFITQNATAPAGEFSYVKVLHSDFIISGGTGGGTATVDTGVVTSIVRSMVSSLSSLAGGGTTSVVSSTQPASQRWSYMGVWVGSRSATIPVEYSLWLAIPAAGYWGWFSISE